MLFILKSIDKTITSPAGQIAKMQFYFMIILRISQPTIPILVSA